MQKTILKLILNSKKLVNEVRLTEQTASPFLHPHHAMILIYAIVYDIV